LQDPVHRQVHARGQRPRFAAHLARHRDPGRGRAGDQLLHTGRAGRGRARQLLARPAQDAEHRAHLAQRLRAGLLDRLERRAGALGLLVEQVERGAGLDVDERHVVRQHVVQLARDPEALLAGAGDLLLATRSLGLVPPLLAEGDELDRRGQHEHPGGQADHLAERRRAGVADPRRQPSEADPGHRGREPRHAAVAAEDGHGERDGEGDERRAARVVERPVGERRQEREREHGQRRAPEPVQRERAGGQQADAEHVERLAPLLDVREGGGAAHLDHRDAQRDRRIGRHALEAQARGSHQLV
jgi:hypothetical protein